MNIRRDVVAVPIKNFSHAKSRLREVLERGEIEDLARSLAAGVIASCTPRDCVVLCDDDSVASFAAQHGAQVLRVTGEGLNGAVSEGYEELSLHYDLIIIAHSDLANSIGLGEFEFDSGITIVTDRHGVGTNVLALPANLSFEFVYGERSAANHREEARRLGLPVQWITDSRWGDDIDGPQDMHLLNR